MAEEKRKEEQQRVKEIPEKYNKKIQEMIKQRNEYAQNVARFSLQVTNLLNKLDEAKAKVMDYQKRDKNLFDKINTLLQKTFKKFKLDKDKGHRWHYDGAGHFIGVPIPKKIKKDENINPNKQ